MANLLIGVLAMMFSLAVEAADDQEGCRKAVEMQLLAEKMVAPGSAFANDGNRKAEDIRRMREARMPECDIQRRIFGTAAELPADRQQRTQTK